MMIVLSVAFVAISSRGVARADSGCKYPVRFDVVVGAPTARGLHGDGCIAGAEKWALLGQDGDSVLLGRVKVQTGLPRLSVALLDAELDRQDFACEAIFERDKEASCQGKDASSRLKFTVNKSK